MFTKTVLVIVGFYVMAVWFSLMAVNKRKALERAKAWLSAKGRVLESTFFHPPGAKVSRR